MVMARGDDHEAEHLAAVRAAFAHAAETCPAAARSWSGRFCGRPVRVRVVGRELAEQLRRAFEPLFGTPSTTSARDGATTDGAASELTVHAWDRTSTGVGCPGIPYAPDATDVLGPGLMSQFEGGRVLRYDRAAIVKCLDRVRGDLFVCVDDARRAELSERCKPFPHFLATWCHDRGVQILHAGLVARAGRGVLLGGTSGSGKSTAAIASALAGFEFLGDDCVGTERGPDGWRGYACYNAVRVDGSSLARLPHLAPHHHPPGGPRDRAKGLVYMSDVIPDRMAASARLTALVVPHVVGVGPSRVAPTSKGAALRKLAPSTLLRGLGARGVGLAHMAELVRNLPCWDLAIGATVDDVPARLDEVLEKGAP